MLNKKIVLYKPKKFRIEKEEIKENTNIIVKPTYLSICNADLRYYFGNRPDSILNKKLPMILIHEAVGEVIRSNDPKFQINDKVCIIPIFKGNSSLESEYNYDYSGSMFMSSSCDGCMQSYMNLSRNNIVKFNNIKPEYACTIEVASVAMQAIKRIKKHNCHFSDVGIFGTGPIAFWISLLLKEFFKNINITIIGRNQNKLNSFTFVDKTTIIDKGLGFDLIIEAVGGIDISKIVNVIKPTGYILILGISEEDVKINMRELMEKGIIILTSHRSTYQDFSDIIKIIESSEFIRANIKKCVSRIVTVKSLNNIYDCMETSKRYQFKTVIDWRI